MSTRVMIALSNTIFSDGIAGLLQGEGDIIPLVLKDGEDPYKAMEAFNPDIVLVDFMVLYNVFTGSAASHAPKFILFDTYCSEDNIASAFVKKDIKGVLMRSTDAGLLKKAIKAVAKGEVWLDKANRRSFVAGPRSVKKDTRQELTGREREIVSLVGQGLSNKEIAEKLLIGEVAVRAHLKNILQKLDVRNRPQLIALALKKRGGSVHHGTAFQQ